MEGVRPDPAVLCDLRAFSYRLREMRKSDCLQSVSGYCAAIKQEKLHFHDYIVVTEWIKLHISEMGGYEEVCVIINHTASQTMFYKRLSCIALRFI